MIMMVVNLQGSVNDVLRGVGYYEGIYGAPQQHDVGTGQQEHPSSGAHPTPHQHLRTTSVSCTLAAHQLIYTSQLHVSDASAARQ